MTVTLADIAGRLGVDRSTVSLALNDATAAKLSSRRVEQIRELANHMGYRPNLSARQLTRGKTRCIGVVMNYLEYYPYSHYFNLISEYCSDKGYHAVPLPMKHRDGRPLDEFELVENAAVDGLIVLEYDPETEHYFQRRSEQNAPVIFRAAHPRSHPAEQHHCTRVDFSSAVRDMVQQVVQRGWEHFYLVVERDQDRSNPFVDEHGLLPHEAWGITQAVRQTGIDLPLPERIIPTSTRRAKSRYEAVSQFIETHSLKPGTCLLHCGADGSTGTYAALTNAGLRIGMDIAVAATNATPPWEYVLPLMTTCYERHEQTSRWLVDNVIDLVESTPENRREPRSQVGDYQINLTDSTSQRP